MTDNEKRAHDIAVAMIPLLYDVAKSKAIRNNSEESDIDSYSDYMNAYEAVLPLLNRDFPDCK